MQGWSQLHVAAEFEHAAGFLRRGRQRDRSREARNVDFEISARAFAFDWHFAQSFLRTLHHFWIERLGCVDEIGTEMIIQALQNAADEFQVSGETRRQVKGYQTQL